MLRPQIVAIGRKLGQRGSSVVRTVTLPTGLGRANTMDYLRKGELPMMFIASIDFAAVVRPAAAMVSGISYSWHRLQRSAAATRGAATCGAAAGACGADQQYIAATLRDRDRRAALVVCIVALLGTASRACSANHCRAFPSSSRSLLRS